MRYDIPASANAYGKERPKRMKTAVRYLCLFCAAAALMLALLVGAACIPRGAIEKNMRASAEYLAADIVFPLAVEGVEGSRIDRYADAILLGIAWQYDAADPLRSVMRSAYYFTPYQNENDNLLDAVTEGMDANQQYIRYWHGSLALVRPLLAVMPLRGIYLLNGALLALLAAALLVLLWRRVSRACALGVLAGMLAAAFWFVPLSLEYTWVCLLALTAALLTLRLDAAGRWERFGALMLLVGMTTSYLDFLTAETLTLLVPLLLALRLRREKDPSPARTAWTSALAWGCGYAGMWALKWLLAGAALRENVLPYVTGHIGERASGEIAGVGPIRYVAGAVWRNVFCLFPMGWGVVGALAGLALLAAAAYYGYVCRRPGWDRTLLLVYAAVGLVPYLRYLALRNHSFLHCFFTYRAQMATVLAVALILEELTEGRREHGGKRRKRA